MKKINLIFAPPTSSINRYHFYRDDIGEILAYVNDCGHISTFIAAGQADIWREFLTKKEAVRAALEFSTESIAKTENGNCLIFFDEEAILAA